MKFVYPEFLYALVFLAVPIIIHLFNFRKFKKVYFSNVELLKNVKESTKAKSQLKHLLILISRLVAVFFLVSAFAQPFLPSNEKASVLGTKSVSVYLDNSFSMNGENTEGRLFDVAKKKVNEVLAFYKPTDRFQLLTNDFEGRHQRFYNKDEFLDLLSEVKISPTSRKLSQIVSRQEEALLETEAPRKLLFLISDFQKSTSDLNSVSKDTTIEMVLLPIQAEKNGNLFVDSVWFETPFREIGKQEKLGVRIKNASDERVEDIPIKLEINGKQKALGSFSILPNSYVDTSLFFTNTEPGIQKAIVSITDHPIVFDDRFYFSYSVAERISVLEITASNVKSEVSPLQNLFGGENKFYKISKVNERNIDYASLGKNNLIVLNGLQTIPSGLGQELEKFIRNGGSMVVFPGGNIERKTYNSFLTKVGCANLSILDTNNMKVSRINEENEIFQSVFENNKANNLDLPTTHKHYKFAKTLKTSGDALLSLRNGDDFINKFDVGTGKFYLSSVSLNDEFSNFTRHAMFVTTMLRIAEFSVPVQKIYFEIGKDEAILVNNITPTNESTFHLKDERSGFDIIPEHRAFQGNTTLFFHNQIQDANNYQLNLKNRKIRALSFNYSRKESLLAPFTKEQIQESIIDKGLKNISFLEAADENLEVSLSSLGEKNLWKYCIMLVLLFLGIEVLLIKILR